MPTVAARFESAMGNKLAGLLDMPDRDPKAYALFAHCFTCGKSLAAVRNISKMLTAEVEQLTIQLLQLQFLRYHYNDIELSMFQIDYQMHP